jgi:hypothetical protein
MAANFKAKINFRMARPLKLGRDDMSAATVAHVLRNCVTEFLARFVRAAPVTIGYHEDTNDRSAALNVGS